jgi:hypothetical protein
MATIPRVVYFAQSGVIQTQPGVLSSGTSGTQVGNTYLLPITTANIEVTRPIEALSSFGKFSSLNTAQTNLTTCKATLKAYLGSGGGVSGTSGFFGISSGMLNDLINNTKASSGMAITIAPNGFSMTGILTNIGIDIAMGAFGMIDLGFAGVGNPVITPATATTTEANTNLSLSPITTMSVGTGGALSGVYATSIKFAYDFPTDTLSALGDNPNATQGNLTSTIATKAPYKTTITVEGHGVDPTVLDSVIKNANYAIGDIAISLPNAKVNARSFNNAAGQVSANFSYTAEDTSATISGVTLNVYTQSSGAPSGSGQYGA